MKHHIADSDQFKHSLMVKNRINVNEKSIPIALIFLKRFDIFDKTGGKVINDINIIPIFETCLNKMGTDKTGTAGD
jgi:hypothetical protein